MKCDVCYTKFSPEISSFIYHTYILHHLVSGKELNQHNAHRRKQRTGCYANQRWNKQADATGFDKEKSRMMKQSHNEDVAKKHTYTQFLQCEFDTGFHTRHVNLGSYH